MRQPSRLSLSRGSGLFDALIGLAILAFGLLAITRFQGRLVAQTTEVQSRQAASQLAGELLSTVLVDVSNAACYTLPQAGACANASAITRTSDWADRVAAALPGTVTTEATLTAASGRFQVLVTWTGKGSGDTHTLDLTTDVRP
ncbi:Pilus assembly protein PilV [Rubrivivax sp. A210]|uniref:type IV pilus modification PilV family protein n=1 Tax=Rubrivivax sp. A210 TaxID=2772301 RepID=UPI00191ABA0E|nr:pilus assembly protein PilV [Rubrivivax sp. A210]CAD5371836.1 Pilus assembly protein PilV [Rubrivivax sp. A210]